MRPTSTSSRQEYLRLYREYAKAIRAFENATRDRRRVRELLKNKAKRQVDRRPVGSKPRTQPSKPADAASDSSAQSSRKPAKSWSRRVWMGTILGWATIQGVSTQDPDPEPEPEFDVDRGYDNTSLGLYWNAKRHYLKTKRAYFDFVRRSQITEARKRARENSRYTANLQLLGVESTGGALRSVQEEMKVACHAAWKIYESSPNPKSEAVKKLLLELLSESQLVGVEEVDPGIMKTMQKEVNTLVDSGQLKKVGGTEKK